MNINKLYIIGCGGVGSWLLPAMVRLIGEDHIVLIDGDKLEKKNLDRQLFSEADIGRYKSDALAEQHGCESMPMWYRNELVALDSRDWLMVCVDNNPARAEALESCDEHRCKAIFAANETTSSEAFYYNRKWKGTRLDPRTYYPTIVTDHSDDPRAGAIGCTGDAQKQNVQLVTANMMAASMAAHLFVFWEMKAPKLDRVAAPFFPYLLRNNLTRNETLQVGEM